jgi:extracellular factor (EF) 3-hydroxypalmitic acid methyl ester biosynthesis protein
MKAAKKNIQPIDTSTEVNLQEKTFLVHGNKQIPIQAECASKYSIFFRYLNSHPYPGLDEPVNFLIRNNGKSVELGPCRILPNLGVEENAGRLVFMNDVYDVECLLCTNEVIRLQAPFEQLPAVMACKDNILPSFKQYTADLAYDLTAYKKAFDDQDIQYHEEPDDVRRAVQQAIIETEGSKFMKFFHQKVEELEHQVAGFSREEHQRHGFYFRKQLWEFILCCALMARTNLKPRGYAGDSEMMKMSPICSEQTQAYYGNAHKISSNNSACTPRKNQDIVCCLRSCI